ncbi:MAG: hypothetical protein K2P88_16520 [Chitinophagaceae bacterium]|nr:hypothetical protein [Chitinophagaceae bacterium]
MLPKKTGQLVKFHTPLADEHPDQLYVILEIKEDFERSRADIQALNTGLSFPPVNTVLINDLEIVEVPTNDLVGHQVTILTSNYSYKKGRVIKVNQEKIILDMTKGTNGIETNVLLLIRDKKGRKHTGTLFVN